MLELLKLKVQTERHRLQRPKHLSDKRFERMRKEEIERNASDKLWSEHMEQRHQQIEDEMNEKGAEKIQLDNSQTNLEATMDRDRTGVNENSIDDTNSKLDGTNLVSKSNDITDSNVNTTQNFNSNDITEPNNTKIRDDTITGTVDSKDTKEKGNENKDSNDEKIVLEDADEDKNEEDNEKEKEESKDKEEEEEEKEEEGQEKPGDFDDDF